MAAPQQNIRVTGLREVERNLIELADMYGPRNAIGALRGPIRTALRAAEQQIRNNTPVDSGELRESVRIRIQQPSRALLASSYIPDNSIIIGRVGWFWTANSLWRRALAVEFGNRVTAAQPTLRPALDTLATFATTDFAPEIARSIEATARRLGRRAQAGTLRRR